MDIIKIASVAKFATFIKRADTPGYQPGGNKRPTYQGRYTPVPGGVVKYQPKTIGYHNSAPLNITKGKDIVDINAQGTAVSNQNNLIQVRNEEAVKAARNTAKQQNATLPRGTWNQYKGSNNEPNRNMGMQNGRIQDDPAVNSRYNAITKYNDTQMQAPKDWGWFDRFVYNQATAGDLYGNNVEEIKATDAKQRKEDGRNTEFYVDMRTPEQLRNLAKSEFWPAAWHWLGAWVPGGKSPGQAFKDRLRQRIDATGDRYRTKIQQFGVNVSEDDKPGTMGVEPNAGFVDINGNERYGYMPKKHYINEKGEINPTFNDYNHDVRTRGDGILRYLDVGASPNSRNIDLQSKAYALLNRIADYRSDKNMYSPSTSWSQQAIDTILRDPDFQDIYQAALTMPKHKGLDARRLAQLFLMNGASLLWTK